MKIVSWNVNGLAACKRKGFLRVLANSKADFFCCQEIKIRCPLSAPGRLGFWNPAKRPGDAGALDTGTEGAKPHALRHGHRSL